MKPFSTPLRVYNSKFFREGCREDCKIVIFVSLRNLTPMTDITDISSLTDAQLLEMHAGSGHNEYLGALYNRYTPLIYGVCLKYLRNTEDAADAVMSIFEQLAGKIERYQIGEFRTWIYSVTKNHCMQILRKGSHEISTGFDVGVVETDTVMHLLSGDDKETRYRALEACMEKLPEAQKRCIELFFFEKKSYADIAMETHFTHNHIKSHIQNGKRNLKICIEKRENEAN